LTHEESPDLRIFSPLLIANDVRWEHSAPAPQSVGPVVGTVLFLVIAAIAFLVWLLGRGDRKAHAAAVSKSFELPQGESLNDLALDAAAREENEPSH
jgi:hypothetical protein